MNAFPVIFGGLALLIPSSRILLYFHDDPSFLNRIGTLSKPPPIIFSSESHSPNNSGLPLRINFSVFALAFESLSLFPADVTSEKLSSQSWVPKQIYLQLGEIETKFIQPFELIDKRVSPKVDTPPNGPAVDPLSYPSW